MARDGYNQEQLAAEIGMDQATLSARLRGTRRWSVDDLTLLGIAFRIHPGVFFEDPKEFAPSITDRRDRGADQPKRGSWCIHASDRRRLALVA